MKKIPQRTCMGCNTSKPKNELVRIVKNKEGNMNVDKLGKLFGRGAYICDNVNCLEKVMRSKRLERIFKQKVEDNVYNEIRGVIVGSDE